MGLSPAETLSQPTASTGALHPLGVLTKSSCLIPIKTSKEKKT